MVEKFKYLSAAITILGALFKLQHWPGAGIMLIVGSSLLTIYCLVKLFEKQ